MGKNVLRSSGLLPKALLWEGLGPTYSSGVAGGGFPLPTVPTPSSVAGAQCPEGALGPCAGHRAEADFLSSSQLCLRFAV